MKIWFAILFVLLTKNVNGKEDRSKIGKTHRSYETKYYDTLLDHFTYRTYNTTFKLRYLISRTYWKSGNAMLFFCGHEGSIATISNHSGFVWELADQLSAMVVFAEHRYYGDSLPFGNLSFTSAELFGYLSVSQALADYASLIVHLKGSIEGATGSAVVAFGGSYGGMLAAWLRQKYPNVVAGALSSSAPILMVGNTTHCNQAHRVLTKAFNIQGHELCTDHIRALWPILRSPAEGSDLINLTKTFRTCQPLNNTGDLVGLISRAIFEIGVANYPYPFGLTSPMPAWPIKAFCKSLSTETHDPSQLLQAIFTSIQVFYNSTGHTGCIPLQPPDNFDNIAWTLQTCTELPFPSCTDGVTDMFYRDDFNREATDRQCQSRFKIKPRWGWAQTQFWGDKLKTASNIIFSNGLLDPWSAGGIFHSDSKSIEIIPIPNAAHHVDLMASHPHDPYEVRYARSMEKSIIKKWIDEWK